MYFNQFSASVFSRLSAAALGALCLLGSSFAAAQQYPTRTVTIVISNAPGDLADLTSRIISPELSKILGQPVIVENKPGAGTLIGSQYVAKQAPADGYTIAAISVNALLILPLTVKEVSFEPLKDLPPFANIGASKLVFAANTQQPFKTFPDLVAYAKANPGKLNYGSSSSTTRLLTEILLAKDKLNIVYIPYAATAANFMALSQNENQMGFMPEGLALSDASKIQVLAQTGEKRSPNLPNAPLFSELGFAGIPGTSYTLNLRGGTPKPIVDKLHDSVVRVLQIPEVRGAIEKLTLEVASPTPPEAIVKFQTELAANYAAAAKVAGLQPQ